MKASPTNFIYERLKRAWNGSPSPNDRLVSPQMVGFYVFLFLITLALWQFAGEKYLLGRLLISTPTKVLNYFFLERSNLITATFQTTAESLLGLSFATLLGFGLMILCLYFPWFLDLLLPGMVVSQVIPLISLAPFFIMVLGFGLLSKVAMVVLMSVFPIFISFAQGVKMVPASAIDLFKIHKASRTMCIRYLYFPMSLPNIFAGIKVASTLAVIGAIVAEFTGADQGLGKNLYLACKKLEPELMIASIILSSVLGLCLFACAKILEKIMITWKPENT
jgi:NitT/TauT family transport system permease protein